MERRKSIVTAAAVGLLAAGLSLGATTSAQAALDPAALAAVDRPEVADAAREIAAVLEGSAGEEPQAILAALHRYLAASAFSSNVLEDALGVVLAGDWSDAQLVALRSIFAEYAPEDVQAPKGGAEPAFHAPAPGASEQARLTAAATSSDDEDESVQARGFSDLPPLTTDRGGSDYQE